jgi:glycosyltransferase involved in cell wall biosynthesis
MTASSAPLPLSVSVVIPVFNEVNSIEREARKIYQFLSDHFEDSELILVDDGSTDGSAAVIDSLALHLRGVRVVRHRVNLGIGAAVSSGYAAAQMDAVTYFPADSQAEIADIVEFAPRLLSGADVVVGFRSDRHDYTLVRRLYSFLNLAVHALLFGHVYRDVNWIHLVRRSALRRITTTSRSTFMSGEMIEKIRRSGGRIVEHPAHYRPRLEGTTHVGNFRGARRALVDMLRLRRDLWFKPRSIAPNPSGTVDNK